MDQAVGSISVGPRSFRLVVTRNLPAHRGIHIDVAAGIVRVQPRCRVRTLASALQMVSDNAPRPLTGSAGREVR